MGADKIEELVDGMAPEEAASALTHVLRKVFPLLEEEVRLKLVSNLVGEPSDEKLAGLVHL